MKSWKDDYSPKQIAQLTSYIKSLRGTNPPDPKAPQGDLYIEVDTASTTTVNSQNSDSLKISH
jgi:cytochrome c oxidase cbb3-type subunit 3